MHVYKDGQFLIFELDNWDVVKYDFSRKGRCTLMICKRNSDDKAHAQEAHSTPFMVFFGLTCALIGAIVYKWVAALL